MKRDRLLEAVRETLAKTGFFLFEVRGERGLCFDIVARRDRTLLLLKVLQNVDAFSKANADELRMIAQILRGSPLVVGERSGSGLLEDGVVYARFEVPILSKGSFTEYLEEGVPPFIYSAPGGLYVHLDAESLRRIREERQISLGTLAEMAGVSRRAIQMYLEGMSATVDIAMRLEERLRQPIVLPLNPLSPRSDVLELASPLARLEHLEREVFQRLQRLGFDVLPTLRSPFDAFTQHDETTLLTSVGDRDAQLERKATVVSSVGRVVERGAVLFVDRRSIRVSLQGVPVIGRDELRKARDLDAVEEMIAERKG